MNRKERRAAKRSHAGGAAGSAAAEASRLFAEAVRLQQAGRIFDAEALCRAVLSRDGVHAGALHLLGVVAMQRGLFDEAVRHFRKAAEVRPDIAIGHHSLGRALLAARRPDAAVAAFQQAITLKPDFAEAHKDVGIALLAQGRSREASARFARALELVPELAGNFADTVATLRKVNPALDAAMARASSAWPRLLPADELLGAPGWAAIADDAMLLRVFKTVPASDVALERFVTCARAALLKRAAENPDVEPSVLEFACALARQCFNTDYVFAESPEELGLLERQSKFLTGALEGEGAIAPLQLATVASYRPLSAIADTQKLLHRAWPHPLDDVLTQQIREIDDERQARQAIPRLTAIEGETTAAVRQQYEENPYPRWVVAPSAPQAVSVDDDLRSRFPHSPHRPIGDRAGVDILIAGCGTGEHSIGTARRYKGAKVLAIDISLSSLAYAQRKTRELGLANIEYAQADVLALATIGKSFDIIDASGVLHHLADPWAGWRALLPLLRSGGLMRVGLYSERGRATIVEARKFIAEDGYAATAAEIRRSRQVLIARLPALPRYPDFFSISGCRDLLFHVQEHRLSIPQIKELLDRERLAFIGFELDGGTAQAYRARFPHDVAMTNLESWDSFECERPETFAAMYQFWCQRR
jgi:2-polyprenyl-3-methyl-5-hydroxy-6-metoxy-1,4-benzoquinol methylase/tetratricopeptide (TPR) repeat protein